MTTFSRHANPPFNEEWRSISGYIKYQISNIGRVRDELGIILKPYVDRNGYQSIRLIQNGKGFVFKISDMVADAVVMYSY